MKIYALHYLVRTALVASLLPLVHCNGGDRTVGTPQNTAGSGIATSAGTVSAGGAAAQGVGGTVVMTGSTGGSGGRVVTGAGGSARDAKDSGTQSRPDAGTTGGATTKTGSFPAVTDLEGPGPFTPQIMDGCGPNAAYTCYYPQELAQRGVKNPFLTWGNGAVTVPQMYDLLPHLATHGFVVIAANSPSVTPDLLTGGLDWLFAENDLATSAFYQKLDTSKVAAMGYSLGSVGTFQIAADPRLKTTVHISGGGFDRIGVTNLRNPTAFFCGDLGGDGLIVGDTARANCDLDYQDATVPVFYGIFIGGSHMGVSTSPYMERIRVAVTGWLRWRLMSDESLKSMFVGDQCSLCKDPNWEVKQKNIK